MGTDEACKLWLNDELIWQHYIKGDAMIDRDIVAVLLQPGYNKLLLKVTNSMMDWGYYLRITDGSGNGYYDITFHSPEEMDEKESPPIKVNFSPSGTMVSPTTFSFLHYHSEDQFRSTYHQS